MGCQWSIVTVYLWPDLRRCAEARDIERLAGGTAPAGKWKVVRRGRTPTPSGAPLKRTKGEGLRATRELVEEVAMDQPPLPITLGGTTRNDRGRGHHLLLLDLAVVLVRSHTTKLCARNTADTTRASARNLTAFVSKSVPLPSMSIRIDSLKNNASWFQSATIPTPAGTFGLTIRVRPAPKMLSDVPVGAAFS